LSECRLLGIRLRIHLLFWGVIGVSAAAGLFVETLTLFVLVLIHELGHVAAARELGWRVQEIQLLPFGGVVKMEDELSAEPLDEIVVALAGPFMNLLMVLFALLCWQLGWWTSEWTQFFVTSNFWVAGFNLLPIWPLDGGRIVQAILCFFLSYRQALLVSLGSSILLAAVTMGYGLQELHVNLVAIGTYLLAINVKMYLRFPYHFIRFLLEKYVRAPEDNRIHPLSVPASMQVWEAARLVRRGSAHLFFVRGSGVLTEEQLLHAVLILHKRDEPVGSLVLA